MGLSALLCLNYPPLWQVRLEKPRDEVQEESLRPTVAALKAGFGICQRVATEIRDVLLGEGAIVKKRRSYGVVNGGES